MDRWEGEARHRCSSPWQLCPKTERNDLQTQ